MLGSAPDGEPILNPQVVCLYICNNNTEVRGGGGGLVPARKVRDRGFVSCSGIQQNVSSLFNRKYWILWAASVTES